MTQTQPKILFLDIETRPAKAYVWKLFDVNVGLEQLIEPGGTLCVGAKWADERTTIFYSEWEHGRSTMLNEVHRLITEADAIVTYNGDRFDIPKLMGDFLTEGLAPPPPPTSVDVYKAVRKLGFQSNKLAFVGPYLKLGSKLEHSGFDLWKRVMDGEKSAQDTMKKYCLQDVLLLEEVYFKLRPYITNHPVIHMERHSDDCGVCGSENVQKRGWRTTRCFKIQRLHCQDCGNWSSGARKKIA